MEGSSAGAAATRIALASLLARREGYLEARVEGRSMGATLPEGTLIRVKPGRDRAFSPGDVVAIAVNEKIVVHRVLKVVETRRADRPTSDAAGPASRESRSGPALTGHGSTDDGGPGTGRDLHFLDTQQPGALLLTRGDAEILPDPPVPAAWVIGPVIEARTGEGEWRPVGPAPRSPPLRALPVRASRSLIGALLAVSPALADRTARAMLFGAYLARFVVTLGREGRIVWPT